MLILSLRDNDSTIRFGRETWHEQEITSPPLDVLDVGRRLHRKRICFLVHGYNVADALDVYSRMHRWLRDWYDEVIGVTWPGSRVVFGFWPARGRAKKAGQRLANHLTDVHAEIDIQGHSLGCRVALEAVQHGQLVRNLILAAPAVNDDALTREYRSAEGRVGNKVMIAHSHRDGVLRGSYRLALGRTALGLHGPRVETANSHVVDCAPDVAAHGDYKRSHIYRSAWSEIATGGL